MAIIVIETLNFGLKHLADAAMARGQELHLFTANRDSYQYELSQESTSTVIVTDLDTSNVDVMVDELRKIPNLQGIIRMTDLWSFPCLEAAERLGLPHQSSDAIRLVRNKGRLRQHLHAAGISRSSCVIFDPHISEADELTGRLSFPCVVKDIAGSSSQNVWLVKTPADLRPVIEAARQVEVRGGALTAEPYFLGPLYSLETLTWDGETRVLGVSSRTLSPEPYFREEVLSFPVVFPEAKAKELDDWISSILVSVGYKEGFTHSEFIVTHDGFELVEINPRLGGGLVGEAICQSLDINIHDAFFDLALGRRPALMDTPLHIHGGAAQVLMYASQTGTFDGIEGEDLLALQPGAPRIYPILRTGDYIPTTIDQRGAVAALFAKGETAELALHNALSAFGKLRVRVTEDTA